MMTRTKNQATQFSGQPKDTTILLSSGEKVDVWVNKSIFTPNGCIKREKEFTEKEIENTHLLSFQWPSETKLVAVTDWTPEISTRFSERKCKFALNTVQELSMENWAMVKSVMDRLLEEFDACLLEVSFWGVRLGHKDAESAWRAADSQASVTFLLMHLLADTEYLFRDVQVQWSVSSDPALPSPRSRHPPALVPVQESSTLGSQELLCNSAIAVDGPGSSLSCFSRCNSGELQQLNSLSTDEKLMHILTDMHQVKHAVFRMGQKVDESHKDICLRLDKYFEIGHHKRPDMLPLTHAQSDSDEDMPGPMMLEPSNQVVSLNETDSILGVSSRSIQLANGDEHEAVRTNHAVSRRDPARAQQTPQRPQQERQRQEHRAQDTPQRPQQERHRQEHRSQAGQKIQRGRSAHSDSDNEGRSRSRVSSSERSGRSHSRQSQVARQSGQGGRDGSCNLIDRDDNSQRRGAGASTIKEPSGNDRKTNNYTTASNTVNRSSSITSMAPMNHGQSHRNISAHNSSTHAANSNLPPASRPQSSTAGPQSGRHQTSQAGSQQSSQGQQSSSRKQSPDQQSAPGRQFPSQSVTSPVANYLSVGSAKSKSSQQQTSSRNASTPPVKTSAFSSEWHRHGAGKGKEERQKESFTAEGMGMGSSGGRHSKSEEGAMTLMVQSQVEGRLVRESVQRAYLEDEVKPPKAKSFDTMLCLDISNSMKEGGAFEQMKRTVLQFIEGVEDIVTMHGVEENMGLVTFGDRANVVQNLTNDFNLIRDKIELLKPGGKSPFVEALLVAMAAFVRKGGIVSVSGEWQVKPRVIFISDGLPTESAENSDMDYAQNISSVRLSLSNLLVSFKKGDSKFNKVHPVFFIPVGQRADKNYMRAMSTICDGVYVEPENIKGLCHYFRVQETIGKVLICLRSESEELSPQKIDATMMALTPDLTEQEKQEVNEVVHRELSNPNRARSRQPRPNDLENVFEHTERVNEGKKLPLGTRVIRGPDWNYHDQDGGGPGTVINHNEIHSIHWVHWDTGDYNRYGYSNNRGFDIWKTDEHPRLRIDNEPLDIGMTVKKGKDWKPAEDLTEQGLGQGVIIRKSRPKYMVRWSNGVFQICNWSPSGVQEVDYCPPEEDPDSSHRPPSPGSAFPHDQHSEPAPATFEGQGMWQWCDENNVWHPYDAKINREIESACKKNPRTCIIHKNGKPCRIMFRKMVEKVVNEGNECKVRRLHVST